VYISRAAIYCEDWGDGSGGLASGEVPQRGPGAEPLMGTFDGMEDNLVAIFAWKMFKSHRDLEC